VRGAEAYNAYRLSSAGDYESPTLSTGTFFKGLVALLQDQAADERGR